MKTGAEYPGGFYKFSDEGGTHMDDSGSVTGVAGKQKMETC